MARKVWKDSVPVGDIAVRDLPFGATILHVDCQESGEVTFWFEFEPDYPPGVPTVARKFTIFGTGHTIPEGWEYVGTTLDGPFVWHLYEQF